LNTSKCRGLVCANLNAISIHAYSNISNQANGHDYDLKKISQISIGSKIFYTASKLYASTIIDAKTYFETCR